ncbi:hypothetical protein, partial [Streptomyces neyagawaensis]
MDPRLPQAGAGSGSPAGPYTSRMPGRDSDSSSATRASATAAPSSVPRTRLRKSFHHGRATISHL